MIRHLATGMTTGLMVVGLAGCDGGSTIRQGKPGITAKQVVFRYALRLDSPADLDRAFAAGAAVDTTGLGIGPLLKPEADELPLDGDRKFVELLKKNCGTSVARLLLSRSSSSNGADEGWGELLLLVNGGDGLVKDKELLSRFVYSPQELRTCGIGWHENVIASNDLDVWRIDGVDHSVIIFQRTTSTTWIGGDSNRTTRDTIATSDVVEEGGDVRRYRSRGMPPFMP